METPIYLNNAATSWPQSTGSSCGGRHRSPESSCASGEDFSTDLDPLTTCRRLLAARMTVPGLRRIVLTHGTTQSLNLALLGLELKPGQRVVTTTTGHNWVLRPLYRLQDQAGILLKIIGLTPEGCMDFLAQLGRPACVPLSVSKQKVLNVTVRLASLSLREHKLQGEKPGAESVCLCPRLSQQHKSVGSYEYFNTIPSSVSIISSSRSVTFSIRV